MLAGGTHANTARPRIAKNLAWKIANVLLCRTELNNDWEERSQMRNRKATTAEKQGNGARALRDRTPWGWCTAGISPAPPWAAHLGWLTLPSTTWEIHGKTCPGNWVKWEAMDGFSFSPYSWNGLSDICGVDRKMPSENTLRIPPGLKAMPWPVNNY